MVQGDSQNDFDSDWPATIWNQTLQNSCDDSLDYVDVEKKMPHDFTYSQKNGKLNTRIHYTKQ